MKNNILEFYKDKHEIPLFYCESGSRLWGIASPDSDYDVRGIHLLSKEQYFGFKKEPDTLSKMDGLFDFESFSLDKFCQLILKSNPNLLEWLRSDLVYFNELPDWENFRVEVLKNIDMSALYFHYLSIAKGHIA
ncbi:MAG: nucleotidyltransferase, partial [Pseudopedobacter saltans]